MPGEPGDAFEIGFVGDDLNGVFRTPERAPDNARFKAPDELSAAIRESFDDAENGAVFFNVGQGFLLRE